MSIPGRDWYFVCAKEITITGKWLRLGLDCQLLYKNLYSPRNGSNTKTQQYEHTYKQSENNAPAVIFKRAIVRQ